jgi:hypothetical protein
MKLRNLALSLGAITLLVPATLLASGYEIKVKDKSSGNVISCRVLTGTYIRPSAKESCGLGGRRNRTFSRQNIEDTGALSVMEALSKLDANFGPAAPSFVTVAPSVSSSPVNTSPESPSK